MTMDEIEAVGLRTTRVAPPAPVGLAAVRDRVAAHLGAAVDADGAVRQPCASRALESALLLVLLRRRGGHPGPVRRLVDFLATPPAQATAFDSALAQAVLHGRTTGADVVGEELLAGFDHFSIARKRLLFDAYLAATGAVPFDESMLQPVRLAGPGEDNTVSWIEMIMLSVRVLVAYRLGRGAEVTDLERERLLELLGSSSAPVWENYLAAHLLALLAVQEFAPAHPLTEAGVSGLLGCLNVDGGVPPMSNLAVFNTGPAGLALAPPAGCSTPSTRTAPSNAAGA
ncbi:hypothetical protein [Streptomyces sp. cg2]|uniref:hypothetical protein n=1 Tax=Streptomyces sp. cg2 TaxID=3238799 RepID=UPI0034E1CC1F